jgi:glycosyltransferase involved in cell wall biosynthesis
MVHLVASTLATRGHEVTLYAAPGSVFEGGELVTARDEREFAPHGFDVVLDSTHGKIMQQRLHDKQAVVSWSHDREAPAGRCAVYPSEAHKRWHQHALGAAASGRVIYNGVAIPDEPVGAGDGDYYAYLSVFHAPKGPVMALEAARLAGVKVVFAGPTPPAPPPGAKYIGPVIDEDKRAFLGKAKALLFPASTEAGPVTILEAQAMGCPVLVSAYGAAQENMQPGVTGWVCEDTVDMADHIAEVSNMDRAAIRAWVRANRGSERMVDQFERALYDAAAGEVW